MILQRLNEWRKGSRIFEFFMALIILFKSKYKLDECFSFFAKLAAFFFYFSLCRHAISSNVKVLTFIRKTSLVPCDLKARASSWYIIVHEVNHLSGAVTKFKIRFYLFEQNFNCIKFFREKINPSPTLQLGRKEFYPGKWLKALEHLFGGLRRFKGSICFLLLPVSSKEKHAPSLQFVTQFPLS